MNLSESTTTIRESGTDWLVSIDALDEGDGQRMGFTLRLARRDQTVAELQQQALGVARALLGEMLVR